MPSISCSELLLGRSWLTTAPYSGWHSLLHKAHRALPTCSGPLLRVGMPSLTCPKLGPLRWVLPIRKERLGGVGRSGPPWGTLGAPCGTPRTLSARMGRAPHTGPVDPLRSYLGQGLKTDSPEPEAAFCTKIFNKNSSVQNHSQTEAANAAPRPAEGETGGRAAPRVAGRLLSAPEAARTCLRAQGHPQLATPTTDNTHRPRDQPVLPTQDTCASALAARATPGAQPPSQGGAWCEQGHNNISETIHYCFEAKLR